MIAKVMKEFYDKEAGSKRNVDEEFELTAERCNEIAIVEERLGYDLIRIMIEDSPSDEMGGQDTADGSGADEAENDTLDNTNDTTPANGLDIEDMTVVQLRAYATEKNIDLGTATKKADILTAVKAAV